MGRGLVTGGSWDRQAIVRDTQTGRPIRHLQDPTTSDQETVAVGWSPDGSTVATGGGQGKVILWRAADWRRLAALPADSSWVWCLAFSPDGSLLAAGGAGGRSATVWNVTSRKLVARLPHSLILGSVAIDPGDKLLATSAADGKVRLWDIASQRQIGTALPGAENGSGINVSAFRSQRQAPRRRLRHRHRLRLGHGPRPLEAAGLHGGRPVPDPGGVEKAAPRSALPARLPVV
jgi:WD40 repeat protein